MFQESIRPMLPGDVPDAVPGNESCGRALHARCTSAVRDGRRCLALELDGRYDLSAVRICNASAGCYQVYASADGRIFQKIAYQNNNARSSANGDLYDVSADPRAKGVCVVRITTSGASAPEARLYGEKISEVIPAPKEIFVSDFADSDWAEEYARFRNDPAYAQRKTLAELGCMVGRVVGLPWKDWFVFRVESVGSGDHDAFALESRNGKIHISGRNGISLASGFNFYLKNYAHVNYSPMFGSHTALPETLPEVPGRIVKEARYPVRYALNFCTYGYTMAFWDWKEYEPFLDWCAMNGVTVLLDLVGQEEVQRRLLRRFGYSDAEIREYLPGPAYLPWFYMQNLSGFGGPLPDCWFAQRVELGRKIHDRMQVFGIDPVMPGYAGMVPGDFALKHPDADVIPQGKWCGFDRPAMLRTYGSESGYFDRMAPAFYQLQKDVFGDVAHYYAVDPFHEGGIVDGMDLPAVYHCVQQKMLESDPHAVWILMQWQGQITDEKIKNLANPRQVLVLDLQADRRSYADVMERRQVPWVWCMVHNFGGRMGVDGDVVTLARDLPARYDSTDYMTGIGVVPEAFGNSPVVYDLLFDMTWTHAPIDCQSYIRHYAESRYGSVNGDMLHAWDLLLRTAYWKKRGYAQGAMESVIYACPGEEFSAASTWGHSRYEYDKLKFEQVLLDFIAAYDTYGGIETFRYDMVDVTKQVLATAAMEYHKRMIHAYREKNPAAFRELSGCFLNLIRLQDQVLACSAEFTVGKWLEAARGMHEGMDDWTKDLFEFNARALITTWGGRAAFDSGLNDYSNRQWAGVTRDYYLPRWEDYIARCTAALENHTPPAARDYFAQEWEWANRKSDEMGDGYAKTASGADLKALAQKAYDKFSLTRLGAFSGSETEAENVAKGKAVTSTLATAQGSLTDLTDGDVTTTWKAAEAGAVTLTVDLGGCYRIEAIAFHLPDVAGDYGWDYAIRVLTDGGWTQVPARQRATLLGKISVPCHMSGSKVEYTFTPKKDAPAGLTAEFAELLVYGQGAN